MTERLSPLTRNLLLLFLSLLLNVVLATYLFRLLTQRENSIAWRGVFPKYSPVDGLYSHEERVTLGLLERSEYHGPPSDELDRRWESLYNVGISAILTKDAARLANDTDEIRMAPGRYIVQLHVFHALECVDTLRKYYWPEHYPWAQKERYINLDGHPFDRIDYCLNAVRESLLCSADVTPNLWKWNPKAKKSSVEFNNLHTCRNFGEIREWARVHQVPPGLADAIRENGALPPFFPLTYPGGY